MRGRTVDRLLAEESKQDPLSGFTVSAAHHHAQDFQRPRSQLPRIARADGAGQHRDFRWFTRPQQAGGQSAACGGGAVDQQSGQSLHLGRVRGIDNSAHLAQCRRRAVSRGSQLTIRVSHVVWIGRSSVSARPLTPRFRSR